MKYKHYITINENNIVTDTFSETQKKPTDNDIILRENVNASFSKRIISSEKYLYKYILNENLTDNDEIEIQGDNGALVKLKEDNYINDIQYYKNKKKKQLIANTNKLKEQGFTYENRVFSLDTESQIKWFSIFKNKDTMTFPMEISTIDDDEFYELTYNNIDTFFMAGMGRIKELEDQERTIKKEINALSNISDVFNYQDTRNV